MAIRETEALEATSWIVALNEGIDVYVQMWGDSGDRWWWPVIDCATDVGLIGIYVSGIRQVIDLGKVNRIKIGECEIVENDDIYGDI